MYTADYAMGNYGLSMVCVGFFGLGIGVLLSNSRILATGAACAVLGILLGATAKLSTFIAPMSSYSGEAYEAVEKFVTGGWF